MASDGDVVQLAGAAGCDGPGPVVAPRGRCKNILHTSSKESFPEGAYLNQPGDVRFNERLDLAVQPFPARLEPPSAPVLLGQDFQAKEIV